jgi:hypothetical protein
MPMAIHFMRAAASALVVGTAFTVGGVETAAADPNDNASPFEIQNNTKYDLVFWDYSTTDKYPESGPDHGVKAAPGKSFHFTLRQIGGSASDKRNNGKTTIQANFHTFNAAGQDIPAGMATMQIRFSADGMGNWNSFVNCWASADRSCGPRPPEPGGQVFAGNTVTFTG